MNVESLILKNRLLKAKYFFKNHGIYFIFILGALLPFVSAKAFADNPDTNHLYVENGWIEKMNNKLAIDVSFNNDYEIFEVNTPSTRIELYPNIANNLRLKLNYKFISVSYKFSPGFLPGNGDEEIKGKTKSFFLGTSLIFRDWFAEVSYSKVQGYYLQNTEDFIDWQDGDPYTQFPDLHYGGISLKAGYLGNSAFSLRSLTSHTERQLKSAGSFIPAFMFRYYIDDKSGQGTTQKSNSIETIAGPGYAYTFVIDRRFYFSLSAMAGAGYMNTKLTTRLPEGDNISHQDNFIFRWEGISGIGYNSSKFYTGLYVDITGAQYRQENTSVMNHETRIYYHLFLGIRLEAPKFMREKVTQVEERIPGL